MLRVERGSSSSRPQTSAKQYLQTSSSNARVKSVARSSFACPCSGPNISSLISFPRATSASAIRPSSLVRGLVREVEVRLATLELPALVGPHELVPVVPDQREHRVVGEVSGDVDPGALGRRAVSVDVDRRVVDEMQVRRALARPAVQRPDQQLLNLRRPLRATEIAEPLAVLGEQLRVRGEVTPVELPPVLHEQPPDRLEVLQPSYSRV